MGLGHTSVVTTLANRGAPESQALLSAALLVPAFALLVAKTVPYVSGGLANAWGVRGLTVWSLVLTVVVDAYFLVVVAVLARDAGRRRRAVAAATAGTLVDLVAWLVFTFVLEGIAAQWVDIVLSTVTLLLFTTAWGLARRRHPRWLAGLPPCVPIVAGLMWLSYQGWLYLGAWTQYGAWWMGTFVLCCLICWAVDAATKPQAYRAAGGG